MPRPSSKLQAAPPSVCAHAAASGESLRQKFGPVLGWSELLRLLQDRACAPYPCEVRFDAQPLLPGELAHALPKGLDPRDGFTIVVHPAFESQSDRATYLVLYQLALVNYGDSASTDAAETFGAHALGLTKECYYQALCEMADQISGDELV